jgi:hypothetical protein
MGEEAQGCMQFMKSKSGLLEQLTADSVMNVATAARRPFEKWTSNLHK